MTHMGLLFLLAIALCVVLQYVPSWCAPLPLCAVIGGVIGWHTRQERTAPVPIWRYLRFPVSDPLGLALLWAFSGSLIVLASLGLAGGHRWALWALAVALSADCLFSHWLPWLCGRRPNPGLTTTPLYAVAVVLIVALLRGTS